MHLDLRFTSARLWVTLFLVLLVIVFTLQNTENIGVDFLFWELEASGAIFVFLNVAVGAIVGWVVGSRGASAERS